MQENSGANGFMINGVNGMVLSHVIGKKYATSSALFRRKPTAIKSLSGPQLKLNCVGTVYGGSTRVWPLKMKGMLQFVVNVT